MTENWVPGLLKLGQRQELQWPKDLPKVAGVGVYTKLKQESVLSNVRSALPAEYILSY